MPDARKAVRYTHKDNIDGYGRLLKTFLTATEREFIERRLAEENKLYAKRLHDANFCRAGEVAFPPK
jgi:hypothetical protein